MAPEPKERDFLEGFEVIEEVVGVLQESYECLPNKKTATAKLAAAKERVKKELSEGGYGCSFQLSEDTIDKASRMLEKGKDPDKVYRKVNRAIGRDLKECFKRHYGGLI